MAEWDFRADIATLMATALDGRGPQSMPDMLSGAERVVAYSTAQRPEALDEWLRGNATMLVGQQLLVFSVHSQTDIPNRFRAALTEWTDENGPGDQAQMSDQAPLVVEWLKERHPGLLRAWLLSQIEDLVRKALLDAS